MISDIFGVSGRGMLEALAAGQRDPWVLAGLARGSMRGKKSVLAEALTGHFRDHHGYLPRMMPDRADALTAQVEALTGRIEEVIAPSARRGKSFAPVAPKLAPSQCIFTRPSSQTAGGVAVTFPRPASGRG